MDNKKSAVPGSQPDTTQEYVIELSENEIAAIEAEAAENMKNWVEPDKHFFIIPDDETQTLIVCPTERKYQATEPTTGWKPVGSIGGWKPPKAR